MQMQLTTFTRMNELALIQLTIGTYLSQFTPALRQLKCIPAV